MASTKESTQTVASDMRKSKNTTNASVDHETKKRLPLKKFGKFVFFLLFVAAIGAAGYYYYQYRKITKSDQIAEINSLVKEIGKVMDLPADETPTLATVTDKEKLASQPFFKNAQNDDKVLIYVKAGRAILYRTSTHKIVDVSTVNITNEQASPAAAAAATNATQTPSETADVAKDARPTLALYNGAKTLGLTYKVEEQIKGSFASVDVTKKEPAAKTDYTKTVVVDISGKYGSVASDIAKNLGTSVTTLPENEAKPDTDVLVIIGEDKAK